MLEDVDDKELLTLIKHGNIDAFNELYSRYGRMIFNFSNKWAKNSNEAEELTQEVFIKIWEKRKTYISEKSSPKAWILKICKNSIIDFLRRKKNTDYIEESQLDFLVDERINLDDEIELRTTRLMLTNAIANLPEEQKEIIKLMYFDGKTQREIATSLDLPLGTVKSRVKLALSKLKRQLKR